VQQVFEELSANSPFDLGQLPLLGDRERQHKGGLFDGHEGQLLVVRRVIEDRDVAEHLVGGQDRGDEPLSGHADVRECRHLHRPAPGFDLAQHALDLGVEQDALRGALPLDRFLTMGVAGAAGVGKQVEARVLDRDGALEQLGEGGADLLDALAVQDQLGEAAVDFHRSLEAPVLGVDDPLEEGRHQVDHLDVLRHREERDLQAIGLAQHFSRQLAHVWIGPDDQAGAFGVGDLGDQPDLTLGVVFDREAGGEDQVAGPGLDLGRLHGAHPLDRPVEAVGAGHQLGAGEVAEAHGLAHCRLGLGEGVGKDPAGGHKWSLVCGRGTSKPLTTLCSGH